jgi:hypothetical protein
MHLKAGIDRVLRCTGSPGSNEFGDAFGARDGVMSEPHLEAMIERVWRCTSRPMSSKVSDAL